MQRVLILLAALCGSAMAREAPTSPANRELLQLAADCARSVSNCKTCRWQKFGTTTLAVCTQCVTGYIPKNGGRSCWCAPGYKLVTGSCVPCNTGNSAGVYSYCPGSKATSASDPVTCGAHKLTATSVAKSEKECVAAPGWGWTASGAATQCGTGTYNPGYNNRACTRCPGGLTTAAPADGTVDGATSATACLAPPGYYYYRGKAVACAKGYYKTSLANSDCTKCNTGFSTTKTTAADAAADCNVLKAGFSAGAGTVGSVTGAECAADTYRTTDVTYAGSAVNCASCPTGCTTNGVVGASASTMCITPPGFGWTGTICSACAQGKYNQGYNREACTDCDALAATTGTITTDGEGTISADGCKVLPGHGTTRLSDGTLTGAACPVDTYGRDTATYGLVDVECTKCIDNTHTNAGTQTDSTACVTDVGYGYDDGASNICDYAYYNAGDNRTPCNYCGDGLNTTDYGQNEVGDCQTAQGWTGTGATLKPCPKGTWKGVLGSGDCNSCNATGTGSGDWGAVARGMTTSRAYGSIQTEDCDACLPGYGTGITGSPNSGVENDGTFTSLGATTKCTGCLSGYYSAGGATNGAFCAACPLAYAGAVMQSRLRSVTSDACVPQFATASDSYSNNAEWDVIPMALSPNGPLTAKTGTDYDTLAECQNGCAGDTKCQYFVFNVTNAVANPKTGDCAWLVGGASDAAIAKVSGTTILTLPASFYVLFEVKEGQYVTYLVPGDVAGSGIGTTIGGATRYATLDLAKAACDANAACVGISNGAKAADAQWRIFSGTKWESSTGKIRVVGETINSWVA